MSNVVELEHVIGYSGKHPSTLCYLPSDNSKFFYAIGATLVLGNRNDAHDQQFFKLHDAGISNIRCSYNGKYVASAQIASKKRKGNLATVIVWDVEKKKSMYVLDNHTFRVQSLSFSHDDRYLITCGESDAIIWDMANGERAGGLKSSDGSTLFFAEFSSVQSANFNPKRPRYILCSATEKFVKLHQWNFEVKSMGMTLVEQVFQLPGKIAGLTRQYTVARIDDTGNFLYVGTKSGELMVFSIIHGIFRYASLICGHGICSLSTKGEYIYAGGGDGKIKVLKGQDQTWTTVGDVPLFGSVTSITLNNSGGNLLIGTDFGRLYQMSASDLKPNLLESSHIEPVLFASFKNGDSETVATYSEDGSIKIWNLSTYNCVVELKGPSAATCGVIANDLLISGWSDGFIRCFDITTSKLRWQIVNAHRGPISCIAVNTEKRFFCTAGDDAIVRIWSLANNEMLGQYNEHKERITGLQIDIQKPDLIHTCSLDKTVVTFDLKGMRKIQYHVVTDKSFLCMGQRRDSELEIVTGRSDGKIMFWDIDYADAVQSFLDEEKSPIESILVSPSGKYLVTGSFSGKVKVWDIKSKNVIGEGSCHSDVATGVCWSPDEKQIISTGRDGSICIWNFYV